MTVYAAASAAQENVVSAGVGLVARVGLINRNLIDAGPQTALGISASVVNRNVVKAWPDVVPVILTGATVLQRVRIRARALRADVLAGLPETDALGWTAPDAEPHPLWGMSVTLDGATVPNARITSLTIDLDARAGYESCALSVATPRVTRWPSRAPIVITYSSVAIFKGILRTQKREVGTELGWQLEFVGRLSRLRKHRAFRRIYADSDLTQWRLDQPGGADVAGD